MIRRANSCYGLVRYSALVLLFVSVLSSGCGTRTRLGNLIPAHGFSDQRNNELVRIDVVQVGDSVTLAEESVTGLLGGPLAALAAGVALDFLKSELEKEAERYEAQFGKKIFLTTADIGTNKTYIVLSRWVKPKAFTLNDAQKNVFGGLSPGVKKLRAIFTEGNMPPPCSPTKDGHELAFLFVLEVARESEGPFTVRPAYFWSWKAKAKVVDFGIHNGWQPWTWVGALLFKTDSEVDYRIDLTIESLVRIEKSPVALMMNTGPTEPLVSNLSHHLGNTDLRAFSDRRGGWFDIPVYTNKTGYFSVDLKVTERDASNVRKKLLKGAESIEKNKSSIIERITGK